MFAKRMLQITLILVVLASSMAIPRNVSAGSGSICGSVYVVQPGDWLSKIADRCGVTLTALYAANPGVENQRYIYPGQSLNIPDGVPVPVVSQPVNPINGCPNPYCQPYTLPYGDNNIPYFWYASMIVTPQVGGNFYQTAAYVGTQLTFLVNVTNNGDVPLQVILNLTPPSGWDINEEYNNCPDTLNVGNLCTYTWIFTPHDRGVVYMRVFAKGFYTDQFGTDQRVTKSPAFFFNVY